MNGVYSTSMTADRAIQVASQHQATNTANGEDSPLFLYLAFQVSALVFPVYAAPLGSADVLNMPGHGVSRMEG